VSEKITAHRARELLAYDPQTGALTWRVRMSNRVRAGAVAGYSAGGSIKVRVDGREYPASHLAILLVTGVMPVGEVKHENRIRGDNRIQNLEWDKWLAKQENRNG
jgi:hypothetical protein